MEKSRWIWYPGDYEIYHSILLHSRREEFGCEYPSMWGLSNVYPRVTFEREVEFEHDGYIIIHANCKAYVLLDWVRHARGKRIEVKAGKHMIQVAAAKTDGLPAIFCESDQLISDSSWRCSSGSPICDVFAGDEPAYYSPDDNPEVFPFEYTEIKPVSVTKTSVGKLYDFGRELFAKLEFSCNDTVKVIYGETVEEASADDALIYETVAAGVHSLVPRAFRYVTFVGDAEITDARAMLELLSVEYKAKFACDRPDVEKIFDVCSYTFHLNSREFLLDGIKRDRWCWSGDAYQSYLVNDYLFADRALNRRTITALYGKPPYFEHINRINDYSALLIIGTSEYYYNTGDAKFIKFIFPRVKSLYDFIVSRLDENGLVVGRPGDWIFIDWSDIDKDGPLCAEQILLWQAHNAMKLLSEVVGEDGTIYSERADKLKSLINEKYWDEEKYAYIDSFTSGRRNVTRHANIFAILYDFIDHETAEKLVSSVLENDAITKITTPYFELYELMALCKLGRIEYAQNMIDSYWGGMLKLGATTIWEQYDPTQSGAEHYAMYGNRFGKSLCHAWGSGPVYLLGRYCLGVHPTSVGAATFAVEPNPGLYKELHGVVPIGEGTVKVDLVNGELSVISELDGGTVIWNGNEYKLPKGETLTIK
ncbi:MAG: alpha-rhamnosidase [Clostridiales bacterium]|nr:alpha-rhamnosidase [Clostridiales bacterium]